MIPSYSAVSNETAVLDGVSARASGQSAVQARHAEELKGGAATLRLN